MEYKAKSLTAIAEHFESMARECDKRQGGARTIRDGKVLQGQGQAWRAAAAILRDTKLED